MAKISLQDLLLAGCHFGHLTRRWNPKMKKYIFMQRNGIHIIDLKKTQAKLEEACDAISEISRRGGEVLLVGTKKQAKDVIRVEAERCGMPYVTDRWLGGTLTNFVTVKKSVKRMKNLDKKSTDGTYDKLSKKEILSIEREKAKLYKVLGGIADMNHIPSAMFVIDAKKESIAIKEAIRLNIPIFALVDTNTDPDPIDYIIPCNDDAFKAINVVTHAITEAIIEGKRNKATQQEEEVAEAVPAEAPAPAKEEDSKE